MPFIKNYDILIPCKNYRESESLFTQLSARERNTHRIFIDFYITDKGVGCVFEDMWLSDFYLDELEVFSEWLYEEFGIRPEGWLIVDDDETSWRVELDSSGVIHSHDMAWVFDKTIAKLENLKQLSEGF